ncbi:hypothetical protein BH11MYX2_BH11MYX2_39560 [soil metagenome]
MHRDGDGGCNPVCEVSLNEDAPCHIDRRLRGGCYAPDLPDCAVACAKDDDCAGDQICTEQGRCAGASQTCNGATSDAGTGANDDAGSGSAQMVTLRVDIMGEGKVTVTNVGDCVSPSGPMGCQWMVATGRYELKAIATKTDKQFEKWTSLVCAGQSSTCNTDIVVGSTVAAKFH